MVKSSKVWRLIQFAFKVLHASYLRHSQKYTFQVSSPKAKAIICIYNVGNVLSDIFDRDRERKVL